MTVAHLLLQDGTCFKGKAMGYIGTSGGEICFNTGMTGYQEIYTDPSYAGQIVVNTTAHVGNYGTKNTEEESTHPHLKGIVVNVFSNEYSRYTADCSLQQFLEQHKIVGIADIDTRSLVRHIRAKGTMNALISSTLSVEEMTEPLAQIPSMQGLELASQVSTPVRYIIDHDQATHTVAVLDVGIKKSILSNLTSRGCKIYVFPAKTSFEEMKAINPDGFFISNGPGDPASMDYAITTIRSLIDYGKPVFGICLGHQLIALACGLKTYKMHYGHHGLNHPVKNQITGFGEITSQNHGFSVSPEGFENHPHIKITHEHLNDGTIMGLEMLNKQVFSVQYHPEASPGPHDSTYLFDHFVALMKSPG